MKEHERLIQNHKRLLHAVSEFGKAGCEIMKECLDKMPSVFSNEQTIDDERLVELLNYEHNLSESWKRRSKPRYEVQLRLIRVIGLTREKTISREDAIERLRKMSKRLHKKTIEMIEMMMEINEGLDRTDE